MSYWWVILGFSIAGGLAVPLSGLVVKFEDWLEHRRWNKQQGC